MVMNTWAITRSISNHVLSIVCPSDLVGKITNLFFAAVPIVFYSYNKFYPITLTQLSSRERLEVRSLIEEGKRSSSMESFDKAVIMLAGKDELDLWTRLILNVGALNQSAKKLVIGASTWIQRAPEHLKIALYDILPPID
jgi:hypothetical protein